MLVRIETVTTVTGQALGFAITRGQDGIDQPPGETVIAMIETGTGTVGVMATAMIIVEAIEMTTGEKEMTLRVATRILTRTWKQTIQGDGGMTVKEMNE
jgi:hypothetical protein